MVKGHFRKEGSGQTAMADAVMTLILLMLASTVLYASVSGAIATSSDARQRADLRTMAEGSGAMPLEATAPEVRFTNLSSGGSHIIENITGMDILVLYFELGAHSMRSGDEYSTNALVAGLRTLYELVFQGRAFAVHAYCDSDDGLHQDLFFSSDDGGTGGHIEGPSDVPHPRVVSRHEVPHDVLEITIDIYVWK